MLKVTPFLMAAVAATFVAVPTVSHAAQLDPMQCSVSVQHRINNTVVLNYVKDFVVGVDSPFNDNFSSATRFRFFDAFLTSENGTPIVRIAFDSDVSVFNAVTFGASLKVHDETHGETASGDQGFFGGAGVGSNRTNWTLTCQRAF
ncbi:MAG: hypothetical protein AB7I50_20970 [Vicinamibacterales bacterium]